MFAYYTKWIDRFADKIRPIAETTIFTINKDTNALHVFELLKQGLENAALHSIDESKPFVVECYASDIAISATRNKGGRPLLLCHAPYKVANCIILLSKKKPLQLQKQLESGSI